MSKISLPNQANTITLAELNTLVSDDNVVGLASTDTITGVKTIDSSALKVKGSSTGTTSIASANASVTDYTATLPAKTGTVAMLDDVSSGGITALTGDVTASGTGSVVATIANNVVTLAKMATMATASFLGRNTAGTGNVEVLSVATVKSLLGLTGTNSGDQTITLIGDVTGSGTGSFTATIANNAVTLAKMATMATDSFLGRTTAGTGNVESLSASVAGLILAPAWTSFTPTLSGMTLGNGTLSCYLQTIGKTTFYRIKITFGSTTSVSSAVTISYPATKASTITTRHVVGYGYAYDSSAGTYVVLMAQDNGSNSITLVSDSGGINNTSPWTWATNDVISFSGTHETA